MKRLLLLVVLVAGFTATSDAHYRHGGGVSFGIFYSSLEPHGEWILVDRGVYAWRPYDVFPGWRPYTVGRWAWTRYGWYWVSEEPWGWATYHYGRWYYDDFYGWLWIPGYEWAPAWVEWRYGGPYVGWAPLGPYALFSVHLGIHYRYRWVTPVYYWTFVDCRYISSPSVHRYAYRSEDNRRYIGRTRTAGSVRSEQGRILTRGPEREYVERQGRVRIPSVEVVDTDDRQERLTRSGDRERIEVFRPRIEESSRDEAGARPSRVREDRKVQLDVQRTDIRKQQSDGRVDLEQGVREDTRNRRDEAREPQRVEPRRPQQRPEQREDRSREQARPERQSTPDRDGRIERRQPERSAPQKREVERPAEEKSRESIRESRGQREAPRSSVPERRERREETEKRGGGESRGQRPR